MLAHDVRTTSTATILPLVILLSLISALSGCGSGGKLAEPAGQAPLIITQPADQSIPMGLQATFSITTRAVLTYLAVFVATNLIAVNLSGAWKPTESLVLTAVFTTGVWGLQHNEALLPLLLL